MLATMQPRLRETQREAWTASAVQHELVEPAALEALPAPAGSHTSQRSHAASPATTRMQASAKMPLSIDAPLTHGPLDEGDAESLSSVIESPNEPLEEQVLTQVGRHELRQAMDQLLATLTPREGQIIRLRFGFDGPALSLEETGQVLGLTRERVRQIEGACLNRLAERFEALYGDTDAKTSWMV